MGRENHTKPRSVRVPDDLWEAVTAAAATEGRTVTDVITVALRRYVRAQRVSRTDPSRP